MRRIPFLVPLLFLAGCLTSEPPRFAVEPLPSAARIATSAETISIADVSLPAYAKEQRIIVQNPSGALVPLDDADWADEQERAMTYALVRYVAEISGAQVAADPWPLGGIPEAEVKVFVGTMLYDRTGMLTLAGQFSVRRDVQESRSRIVPFDIRIPAGSSTPDGIAQVHGAAWRALAVLIAQAV
ncbi:ABC-type transport auxiliary lipoprotein family protein [Fulvimarina sp. 2208YS6-2-32]|uniref:ABC-type transport auxiliary lipoprotein family protein n=1 Tax=Fulvimarina uroteuthidis TaxID=3098149 RepID=A0ABU5I116_9HYPH|nr:ABC-type transport auxiliary lipoprotein family protein [Fulvimarina sp. 2208YS6-2-32]MDY8108822.1 ABC-type transport auxiliary lipoprotein family protein [Fulvimarina sp. 2208YS6-2-32]